MLNNTIKVFLFNRKNNNMLHKTTEQELFEIVKKTLEVSKYHNDRENHYEIVGSGTDCESIYVEFNCSDAVLNDIKTTQLYLTHYNSVPYLEDKESISEYRIWNEI